LDDACFERDTEMETNIIIAILALGTLIAVAVFAYVSKIKTEKRLKDPKAEKSTLAADKSSHGKPTDV